MQPHEHISSVDCPLDGIPAPDEVILSAAAHLVLSGDVFSPEAPVLIAEPPSGLLQFPTRDTKVIFATPEKRRKGKTMSRRSGQNGYVEVSGNWHVVRWWQDVVGQEKRRHMRAKICPVKGPGLLTASQRKKTP